ncbi:hypothetical protein [Elstera sp.]|jgi:hypothetical protein|uniref:hypothetical protein n=1 Tax=Elstera sp. TaxID=1916664 RepID=UPI0037BFC18B
MEELLKRILDKLEDAKQWRGRLEEQMHLLSHQVAELATEVRVRAENADQRHRETSARLRDAETALRGGGAVDVNISSGNQTVGAEPAATATKAGLLKPAATVGGSGLFGWLAGGGWEQLIAALKKWTG